MKRIEYTKEYRAWMLELFLALVVMDTQSTEDENPEAQKAAEDKQRVFGKKLVGIMKALGLEDVEQHECGYEFATIPATPGYEQVPVMGLLAHKDSYHGTSGANVKPRVIEGYDGKSDIVLTATGEKITTDDSPNLRKCAGHTIITSDGTTLLAADDKGGVVAILCLAKHLMEHPEIPHGKIRICFTTNEEVGRGTEHFWPGSKYPGMLEYFGVDFAFTLDGSDLGEVEDETFNADLAVVTVEGKDVHPGYAKGKMVNAVRVAADIVTRLHQDRLPETTEGRDGYLHAYDVRGDVNKVEIKVLVRSFTMEELRELEEALQAIVSAVSALNPGVKVDVKIVEQYRNMLYEIQKDPRIMGLAAVACVLHGIEFKRKEIRGGTDGAKLTALGVKTPNIWAGGQNFHSVLEWVSLEWMVAASETTVQIITLLGERFKNGSWEV